MRPDGLSPSCATRTSSSTTKCTRCAKAHAAKAVQAAPACSTAHPRAVLCLQDAHEFLNYLLNEAAELLEKREKKATGKSAGRAGSEASASDEPSTPPPYKAKTWIHSIFEGGLSSLSTGIARPTYSPRTPHVLPTYSPRTPHLLPTYSPRTPHVLPTYSPRTPRAQAHDLHRTPPSRRAGILTNETRCLTCETVTRRDECFLDLSLEIEQNSSASSPHSKQHCTHTT